MRRFDAVHDYNACIEPHHPSIWRPRLGDLPLWERHFRLLWNLGVDDLHLIVESIQVNPAQALCRVFGDARIDPYADGLMSYSPTRTALPEMVACRIERLLHLDLVPGVTPLLLSERQVPTAVVPNDSFRAVIKTMVAGRASPGDNGRVAMVVGQYLAAGGFLSERKEFDLYVSKRPRCAVTADLNDLVVAVAYAMQPQRLAARRSEAAAFLADPMKATPATSNSACQAACQRGHLPQNRRLDVASADGWVGLEPRWADGYWARLDLRRAPTIYRQSPQTVETFNSGIFDLGTGLLPAVPQRRHPQPRSRPAAGHLEGLAFIVGQQPRFPPDAVSNTRERNAKYRLSPMRLGGPSREPRWRIPPREQSSADARAFGHKR
jgi:hypothetical protein